MPPKVKHVYQGNVRWAFMKWADIPDANDPETVYLRRLRILQTPWFAFYLHFIYLPDDDRDPHDHPCNFWALILRGGYVERVYKSRSQGVTQTQRRFSVHKMPVEWAHRITDLKPNTVTLCLFGRRQRNWGFWTEDGWIPWQQYNRAKYGVNPQSMVDEFV